MTRLLVAVPVVAALVIGTVAGAVSMLVVQEAPARPPDPTVARQADAGPLPTLPVQKVTEGVLLVWTPTALPDGLDAAASAAGVVGVTRVRQGIVELATSADADGTIVDRPPDGFVIPLEAVAFDRETFLPFVPSPDRLLLADLAADEVVLGETSAALRGVGRGATLTLADGVEVRVVGVVDDAVIGAAEVAFTATGADRVGLTADRYLLVDYRVGRPHIEDAVRAALPPGAAVRFRSDAETPYLRAGDAVLPQVLIKQRFGEFSYRRTAGDEFEQDPQWVADNIVTADVPILGRVTCHRAVIPTVTAVLDELAAENLETLIDPDGYRGCWVSRFTRTGTTVSRHAWGVALDVNHDRNPTNLGSVQDPRLVEVFERLGFTWGGPWLVPDPSHFEYLRPPPS